MDFCRLREIFLTNLEKSYCILSLKNCFQENNLQSNKAAEAIGKLTGNKIAQKMVKPKPNCDKNLREVEEIIIFPEKGEEILNELRKVS